MKRMYFVGVSTGQSAIRRIFPRWCALAGRTAELTGVDLPVGAAPDEYRAVLGRIRADDQACGALVTTHKVALADHAGHLVEEWGSEARLLGEISCLVRGPDGRLSGDALDATSSGTALEEIVDPRGREVLILGAGGAGTALALHLNRLGGCRVHATDVSAARLSKIAMFGARTHLVLLPEQTDGIIAGLNPGAVVVNATGLGKDLPGSPVTASAAFPKDAVAWEMNYRGDLRFLEYARAQSVRTADGWNCFVLGWSMTMSRTLDFDLTTDLLEKFREVAAEERQKS